MMAAKQGQVHAVSMLLENDAQVDLPAKVSYVFYRIGMAFHVAASETSNTHMRIST